MNRLILHLQGLMRILNLDLCICVIQVSSQEVKKLLAKTAICNLQYVDCDCTCCQPDDMTLLQFVGGEL